MERTSTGRNLPLSVLLLYAKSMQVGAAIKEGGNILYRRKERKIKWRQEFFGGLIYDKTTHKYYELNKPGFAVFEYLDGKTPLRELVQVMVSKFRVTKDQAAGDIVRFLTALADLDLVEIIEANTNAVDSENTTGV
jgi:hypothetical protein